MAQRLSLHHVTRAPLAGDDERPPILLLLHGVGSNELDLFGLASYLDPRFLVVSARAPITLGPDQYAWFPVQFLPTGPVADFEAAERSRALVLGFLDELANAYGGDRAQTYLCGFSQGAIMSIGIGLTSPRSISGLAAMSGRILPEILPLRAPDAELAGLPVLWVHGLRDQTLPIDFGRRAQSELSALPLRLEYEEFPMAHEVTGPSLQRVSGWLSTRLDEAAQKPR